MMAVVFDGKEKLRVARLPRPVPGPKDVLLKVAACGICGGDARSFFTGDRFTGCGRIPGHEVTGVVCEAGEQVTAYAMGDRLALAADIHCGQCWYCRHEMFNMCETLRILGKHVNGGMAEFLLLSEDLLSRGIVNRLPEGLSLYHAALSEPLCSVLASHDDLGVGVGETVAVIGSGPMGVLHYELLTAGGARVVLLDLSSDRLAQARSGFGAQFTIDVSRENPVERMQELTEGVGADVAIVAAPSAAAVRLAINLVRRRGRIGLFGGLPAAEAETPLDINRLHYSELRLVGNFSYHPRYHLRALCLLAEGRIRYERLMTRYPLTGAEQALYDIRQGKVLKAVIVPADFSGELKK